MRFAAVLTLVLLAPFTGELLLGNIAPTPSSWAFSLPLLILLYGGGALLIREVARRLRRGYPTMLGLAVAYGLVEEGIVLGTLFNRDYLGLDLLEYGWMPALGTSLVWTGYVVTIHTVWSILVPIALTERLFPSHAQVPWLRVPGTVAIASVYVLGAVLVGLGNHYTYRFLPSPGQLAAVGALAAAFAGTALSVRGSADRGGRVPGAGVMGGVALLCSSGFIAVQWASPTYGFLPAWAALALMAALAVAAGPVIVVNAGRRQWSARHSLAVLTGAVATYCWAGFLVQFSVHGYSTLGLIAQCAFAAAAAALVALCWRRSPQPATAPVPRGG